MVYSESDRPDSHRKLGIGIALLLVLVLGATWISSNYPMIGRLTIGNPEATTTSTVPRYSTQTTRSTYSTQVLPLELTSEAIEMHQNAWRDVLNESRDDAFIKYAFYTSRILAVEYPEVYLRSDRIKAESYPLALSLDLLHGYSIIGFTEIYPTGYPVFSFLDRRNFPLFLTMHSVSLTMTQVDMASAYYVMTVLKDHGHNDVFVVYCDTEDSYVYSKGRLVSMKNLQAVNSTTGNPVLIFNEDYVWYPLMGRDDTIHSEALRKVVRAYAQQRVVPILSEFEQHIVERLKGVTENVDLNVALQLTEFSWHDDPSAIRYPYEILHCALLLKLADYLSPVPAYLAALGSQFSGEGGIAAIGDEFLKHISKHNYLPNPGDETENTADSSYYTRIASCGPKSFPISVALDFLGITNYVVSGKEMKEHGHFWVYVRDYDLIVSNAGIAAKRTFVAYGEGPNKLIEYVGFKMRGLSFIWFSGEFQLRGNLSPSVVIELLEYVHQRYSDDIGGVNYVDDQRVMVPLQTLVQALNGGL
jgi:hypothetical protein